jgi:hypothetical protein
MTGDQKPSDVASHAVIWSLVADVAKENKDAARAWLSQHMGPDAAAVKAVANGENIGRATWVEGKETLAVFDAAAFQEYVAENWPDELVTTVNPAFQRALLAGLKVVGDTVIDKAGEPVPGVALRESASYVSVKKSAEARATVEALLNGGHLRLEGIAYPELIEADE